MAAAYTPFSIDHHGRLLYTENDGHLFVVGVGEVDR